MSFDIVTLVYSADARGLDEATKAFDRNTAASERNDAAQRRRMTATERAGVTARQAGADYARAASATEKADREAARAAPDLRAQRVLEAAAMREVVQAARQLESEQAKAARAASQAQKQFDSLRASLDATAAVEVKLAQRVQVLDNALAKGVITQQQHAAYLTKATAAAEAGTGVITKYAGATKLSANELANFTFQINDVVTGLLSGQKPFQIAAQQGGQFVQIFQQASARGVGFGSALAGIGRAAGALFLSAGPIVLGVAAVGLLAKAFLDGRKEMADFNNALASTNNYAGLTATSYTEMAKRVAAATDSSTGDIRKLIGQAIASGKFSGETLELAVQNAEKFSQMTGQSAASILKDYEQMKGGVARFGAEHALQYHDITYAQLLHIETLEKEGHASQAQYQLMKDIAERTGDLQTNYGYLETAMHAVTTAAKNMWDAILDIGRPDSAGEAARKAADRLDLVEKRLKATDPASPQYADRKQAVVDVRSELQEAVNKMKAEASAAAAAKRQASEDADKIAKHFGPKDPKPKATPRDTSDERTAELARAVAQARADELQATLGITRDVHARAALEREILAAETDAKKASIDRTIAGIADDKGLSTAKKAELTAAWESVKVQQDAVAKRKTQAINEQEKVDAYLQFIDESVAAAQAQDALDDSRAQAAIEIQKAQASVLRSTFAQDVANVEILKAEQALAETAIQRQIDGAAARGLSANEVEVLKAQLAAMQTTHAAEIELAKQTTTLAEAVKAGIGYVDDFKDAFRRKDWAALVQAFIAAIQTATAAAGSFRGIGALSTIGGMAGTLIGGKVGGALTSLSSAAGLAGSVGGLGALFGGGASAGGAAVLAGTTAELGAAGAAAGGLAGSLGAISAVLGPIGAVVGIVAGLSQLAKAFQKPSNKGAGYDLITGQVTGKSRDDETTSAVTQAADSIKQMQELLKSSGISNLDEIRGLVIGSRDPSQIYTNSGKTITAAKGDPAAAAEAAFKAMLDGAHYVSDTQKKLVQDMVAAGKGFDEVATALQGFAAAQKMLTAVNDEILKLTDPKAYDLEMVKRANDETAKAAKAAYTAGYITADELATLNGQIAKLNGLKIDEVNQRYADSIEDLYDRAATAIQSNIDRYKAMDASLSKFMDTLTTGAAAGLSPEAQYFATKAQFDKVSAAAAGGDETAIGDLQSVSEQYLAASKDYYASSQGYFDDLAKVKDAVSLARDYAKAQVNFAEAQLKEIQDWVVPYLGDVKKNTADTVTAISALAAAIAGMKSGAGGVAAGSGGAANDNQLSAYEAQKAAIQAQVQAMRAGGNTAAANDAFDAAAYLRQNPDVAAAGVDPYQHYIENGQYEIALGARQRGFATGGGFRVGGSSYSGDKVRVGLWANTGEQVNVSRQDNMAAMVAELRALRAEVAGLQKAIGQQTEDLVTQQNAINDAQAERDGDLQKGLKRVGNLAAAA